MYWLVFILFLPFYLIKAGVTQTEKSLFKQYVAGERVDLLDHFFLIILFVLHCNSFFTCLCGSGRARACVCVHQLTLTLEIRIFFIY